MKRSVKIGISVCFLCVFLIPISALANPASFTWGSFDALGATTFGIYENNNATILQTGDLVQFIWAGPDGTIDPPLSNGGTTDDDVILETNAVNNGAPLTPPQRDRGYSPLKLYNYDDTGSLHGGVVYLRAWNAATAAAATAYGDSTTTGTLSNGGNFNAPRFTMTHTPTAVTFSSLIVIQAYSAGWTLSVGLGLLVMVLLSRILLQKGVRFPKQPVRVKCDQP